MPSYATAMDIGWIKKLYILRFIKSFDNKSTSRKENMFPGFQLEYGPLGQVTRAVDLTLFEPKQKSGSSQEVQKGMHCLKFALPRKMSTLVQIQCALV